MDINSRVNGKTKLIGIIGDPIEHTLSPILHNTICSLLNENYIYVPFHIAKNGLEDAVKGLKAMSIAGFNVTVPFKNDIMKYIDEVSDKAKFVGAVNTVKNTNGRLIGYNTDTEGFSRAFGSESCTDLVDKNIVIIGAGGTSRAIAVQLVSEGVKSICIINRTVSKAIEIAESIEMNLGFKVNWFESNDAESIEVFRQADVIINATSVGMTPDSDGIPISDSYKFRKGQVVFDVIYSPLKTKFLEKAKREGCSIINGIGMLYYQGIISNEIWTGRKMDGAQLTELHNAFLNIIKT